MYNWNLEKQIRLDQHHAENWKSARRCDRPLCGARCRNGHSCKAKAVVNSTDKPVNEKCRQPKKIALLGFSFPILYTLAQ